MVQLSFALGEITTKIGAVLEGDPHCVITHLAPLATAKEGSLSFCVLGHERALLNTAASAVIVPKGIKQQHSVKNVLVADNPYLAYAYASHLFAPPLQQPAGVHPTAVIHETATVHPTASIGAHTVVAAHVKIAAGVVIGPLCSIGAGVEIGENAHLHARVTVYHAVIIGQRVLIQSGAVIGSDGFGFAETKGTWVKIAQLGRVIVEDDVEIGANTTIDRGAIDDTVICKGVKLDNQIQIAHNVVLGEHTAMAGQSGIAGSTRIGRYCRIGGGAAIGGHLTVADKVFVSGFSMVTRSIHQSGIYSSGIPARPNHIWKRNVARFQRLDILFSQLKKAGFFHQVDKEQENDD